MASEGWHLCCPSLYWPSHRRFPDFRVEAFNFLCICWRSLRQDKAQAVEMALGSGAGARQRRRERELRLLAQFAMFGLLEGKTPGKTHANAHTLLKRPDWYVKYLRRRMKGRTQQRQAETKEGSSILVYCIICVACVCVCV